MKALSGLALVLLLSSVSKGNADTVTMHQFNLACAVVSTVQIATTKQRTLERDMAFQAYSFYLGRLTQSDDKTSWKAVVLERVADLPSKTEALERFSRCLDFFSNKLR